MNSSSTMSNDATTTRSTRRARADRN
jgi:hypothetical protein